MLQLSEAAKQEWQSYIDYYANKLNTPEHLYYVNNFVGYVKYYGLTSENGKIALYNLIASIANIFNVNISQIYFTNNSTALGTYIPTTRSIIINVNFKDITSLLITIYHEMRHALQMQSLMYGNTEFLKALNYDITHYKMPDSSLIGNADYYTNISEEDAFRFSISAAKNAVLGVKDEYDRARMMQEFEIAKKENLDPIESSKQFNEISNKVTSNYIIDYGIALSYIFQSKESQAEKSVKLFNLINDIKAKYAGSEKIIRNDASLNAGILKFVFDNCTYEELARNIDDPNVSILRGMENYNYLYASGTYADSKMSGTYFGSRFDQLKIYINEARAVLEAYRIPFDKNDNGRMFATFMDVSYDLAANLFERQAKQKFVSGDVKFANLFISMQSYKMLDREKTIRHFIAKYGMKKITSWYTNKFNSKEYRNQTQYPSLQAVDILGYRLDEFERVSKEMNNTSEPNKNTFKSIFEKFVNGGLRPIGPTQA